MEDILRLKGVSKLYGKNVAVNNVSFAIEKGSVCGLLGPNGAGKTTIMKIIMDQVKCSKGYVECDNNLKIRYLADVPNFYEFYSIKEYLHFLLEIVKYEGSKEERIEEVLSMINLGEYGDYTIKKLSRGLRQKVGIASVIIDDPDILILDEPVSALDPLGRKEMFDIINLLRGKVTIIFSSHILEDVERVCDHIILISRGNIILDKAISDIFSNDNILQVIFKNREDALKIKELITYANDFSENIENCLEIEGESILKLQKDIFGLLSKNKIEVKSVAIKCERLEDIFLREVRKNG